MWILSTLPICLVANQTPSKEASVNTSESEKLAALYEKKAGDGLLDVKFYLRNLDDAGTEEVCREVNALYAAAESGAVEALDFNDSRWRDAQ